MAMSDAIAAEEIFGMTDLEEALRGPDGPAVRLEALARLNRMAERIAADLRDGPTPSAFEELTAMADGVSRATRIMARIRC